MGAENDGSPCAGSGSLKNQQRAAADRDGRGPALQTAVADAEREVAGEGGVRKGIGKAGEGHALGAVAMAEHAYQCAAGAVREGEGCGRAVGRVGGGAGGVGCGGAGCGGVGRGDVGCV